MEFFDGTLCNHLVKGEGDEVCKDTHTKMEALRTETANLIKEKHARIQEETERCTEIQTKLDEVRSEMSKLLKEKNAQIQEETERCQEYQQKLEEVRSEMAGLLKDKNVRIKEEADRSQGHFFFLLLSLSLSLSTKQNATFFSCKSTLLVLLPRYPRKTGCSSIGNGPSRKGKEHAYSRRNTALPRYPE
jgi:hypothetical protein